MLLIIIGIILMVWGSRMNRKTKVGEYSKGFNSGLIAGQAYERQRAAQIIEAETKHYGQTHYEGQDCMTCRILEIIKGEDNG